MKVVSVKINYALNLVNTILGVIFPLITFPYVTRILEPCGIGQVQFYNTFIDYIILLSSLGIPLYAVREIAKYRDDDSMRTISTIELFILHLLFTIIGYIVVVVLSLTVGRIQNDISLFLILSGGIILNTIGVQWFFQAIEDFKYITIRSVIIKVICLILLFVVVKDRNDLIWYACIQLFGSAGNYIFNFFRIGKFVKLSLISVKEIHPFKHLKPCCRVFLLNIAVGIYTQLSFLLLGFLQGDESVGYYSIPYRIVSVSMCLITSLGAVLLPRFSNLIGSNKMNEFKVLGDKAISFIVALIMPMCFGLIVLANPIINVISGDKFMFSIPVLIILALTIIPIGLSQVLGKYMLYPIGKELLMVKSTIIGMITYLIVGIPLIMLCSQNGAAMATLLAEIAVTLSMFLFGRKYIPCNIFTKENLVYILAAVIMFVIIILCTFLITNIFTKLIVGLLVGVLTYVVVLALFNNQFYLEFKRIILKR